MHYATQNSIMPHRMSSSFSGKLQKAIRNCSCSGTGGRKCSTTSNGICRATAWAVNSTNDEICPSATAKVNYHVIKNAIHVNLDNEHKNSCWYVDTYVPVAPNVWSKTIKYVKMLQLKSTSCSSYTQTSNTNIITVYIMLCILHI